MMNDDLLHLRVSCLIFAIITQYREGVRGSTASSLNLFRTNCKTCQDREVNVYDRIISFELNYLF